MIISTTHMKQAQSSSGKHTQEQYEMMKKLTGETDNDLARADMILRKVTMDWYNAFYGARKSTRRYTANNKSVSVKI